ncbi:unnamed protein product [Musa hybrid cultivar]
MGPLKPLVYLLRLKAATGSLVSLLLVEVILKECAIFFQAR